MLQRLQKFSKQNRKPLELQHHKPIPIPTYIPKFQEKYSIIHLSYLLFISQNKFLNQILCNYIAFLSINIMIRIKRVTI